MTEHEDASSSVSSKVSTSAGMAEKSGAVLVRRITLLRVQFPAPNVGLPERSWCAFIRRYKVVRLHHPTPNDFQLEYSSVGESAKLIPSRSMVQFHLLQPIYCGVSVVANAAGCKPATLETSLVQFQPSQNFER